MKFVSCFLMFILVVPALLTAGCIDQVKDSESVQVTGISLGDQAFAFDYMDSENVFQKIDYNISSQREYFWLTSNYEVVMANPELFEEYATNNTTNLELLGEDIELDLKEVITPEGATSVSLESGQGLLFSELNSSDHFIFEGKVVGEENSNAWFICSRNTGYLVGQIELENKMYQIMATGKDYGGKPIEVIFLSQYQSGDLNLTVMPERSEIKEGETFDILIKLTNTGNNTLNVWRMSEQISFELDFKPLAGEEDGYAEYSCGVIERVPMTNKDLVELKPGQSINKTINSGCWVLSPGEYKLKAAYYTSEDEMISEPYWLGKIRSNETIIRVLKNN